MQQRKGARPVVVGVDGSPECWAAVEAGAWEAGARRVPLVLANGYLGYVPGPLPGWVSYEPLIGRVLDDAGELLARAASRVSERHPELTVRTCAVSGGGSSILIELSREASLVVVGSRGSGGFGGLSLGSVAAQVAAHAHSPVLVVRPGGTASGPVVVGVDGSPASAAAAAFAFEQASWRAVPLVAIYAWWMLPLDNLGPVTPTRYDAKEAQAEADRMLAEAVAGWSDRYRDVTVERRAEHDMNPPAALVEASKGASLVVVGTRGRGGFASLLLGSVSRALIAHAHAPVAVIHESPEMSRNDEE